MKYDKVIKANPEIFGKPPVINVNEYIVLTRVFDEVLEAEVKCYLMNCNDAELKKFLPEAFVETEEQALTKLFELSSRALLKKGFLLCIRDSQSKIPVGYINFNSPIANSGLDDWLIEFWLNKAQRGNGIMTTSVKSVLSYLKSMNVPKVQATVKIENDKSINILERIGFKNIDGKHYGIKDSKIEKTYLYELNLTEL